MTDCNPASYLDFSQPAKIVDNQSQSFIICCFFTPSYEINVQGLQASLEALDISYYLQPIADQGYWEANTRAKPHFLLHCLKHFPKYNIVYLDADAAVKKPLDYFDRLSADIGVYETHRQKGMSHDYLTGTIFLRNCPATLSFVEQWCQQQLNCNRTMVDQDSFDAAMRLCRDDLQVESLPLGYIKIFDREYDGDVFIEQFQASRGQTKLKRQLIRRRNKFIIIGTLSLIILIILFLVS